MKKHYFRLPKILRAANERIGIRFRMACIAAAFVLLAATVATAVTTYHYTQDAMDRASERTTQMIHQLSVNIEGYIEDITNVASYVYYSSDVISTLENQSDGSALSMLEQQRTIENYLNRVMLLSKKDIINYYILTDDSIYHGGRMQKNIDYTCPYSNYEWYQTAQTTSGNIFLPPHTEQLVLNPKYEVVSIVKPFRSITDSSKILGVIKVDLLYSAIEQSARIIDTGERGGLLIINQQNQIIYRDMEQALFDELSNSDFRITSETINVSNEAYLINTSRMNSSGWTVIAANSMQDLMHGSVSAVRTSVFVAALAALTAVVLVFITIHRYLQPLDELVSVMKQVETGDLTVNFPITRADEIGYVGKSFNSMVTTLHQNIEEKEELIKRVYTAEMLNTEAQLFALQSQIKPHFLYNTLNLFSIQIQMGMLEDAVACISKLELLLRSITKWKHSIPVEESFQVLDAYLSLQNHRFGKRLSYTLDYAPELEKQQLLPFILQPIVENAVVHGCENNRGQTYIWVKGRVVDNQTIFTVQDSGVGIPEEELSAIRHALKIASTLNGIRQDTGNRSHHLGLTNVHQRIKLRYGENYGIDIESVEGEGTEVTIRLPILDEKEYDE